jgi:hypothetical protein
VLDAAPHHEDLAGAERDVPIAELDRQASAEDQEEVSIFSLSLTLSSMATDDRGSVRAR